jgi:uncharacterized protein (DUF488 family)
MPTLYTIGYQGTPLAAFIRSLRAAGVDAVIDVRLRNTSHLAGYTKKDTLAFLLREGFKIAYEHLPELAPSDELFDAYREGKDWNRYRTQFLALLEARRAEMIGRVVLERYRRPCLLCAEPKAARCHRSVVAEYWTGRVPGLSVTHLGSE